MQTTPQSPTSTTLGTDIKMAFTTSSDSIIIRATLTKKGKKLLSRGKFKIAKFALGDDEVDYRLYNANTADVISDYRPALENTKIIEALKDTDSNIQFGLNSFDAGVLYLDEQQLRLLNGRQPHAFIEFLPVLVKNTKTTYAPTIRNDKYYLSVNDETTKILNDNINNFYFLETNDYEKIKIVVESGITLPLDASGKLLDNVSRILPTMLEREKHILEKFLLDEDLIVNVDNRLIKSIVGIQQTSQFENYASGEKIINFSTELVESPAISYESGFDYYAAFLLKCVPNLMMLHEDFGDLRNLEQLKYSNLNGPRGSVTAFNVVADNELKINSTGVRDSRFTQFGTLNTAVFDEIPTMKFDYIDTTIYIIGTTSNARLQIPLRIIRYAGT